MTRAYTLKDVAARLGISTKTLQRLIAAGNGPRTVRFRRTVRVVEADLVAWLDGL